MVGINKYQMPRNAIPFLEMTTALRRIRSNASPLSPEARQQDVKRCLDDLKAPQEGGELMPYCIEA